MGTAIFWIVMLEIFGSLLIHWISLLPGEWLLGAVGDITKIFIFMFRLGLAYGTAFIASTKIGVETLVKLRSISEWKSIATKVAIVTLLMSMSIYYWGYLSFRSRLEQVIVRENISYGNSSPSELVDLILLAETENRGFWGYFIITTQTNAEIDILDETLVLPASQLSSGINWIIRLVMIVASAWVAYRGAVGGLVERISSVKENRSISYDKIWDFMTNLIED